MVDLACQTIKHKFGEGVDLSCFLVDTSQDGARRPWSSQVRSITTGSCFYSFAFDRLIGASEHLSILGFPTDLELQSLSESSIKDLVGEAFACPTTAVVVLCLATSLGDVFQF